MKMHPIGIIDSGVGALTIWQTLRRMVPGESTIVFSDHAEAPYGKKSPEEVRKRVITLIRYLIGKKVKLIVIACNTATVAGIDAYRAIFRDIPIIGVVPVIKTAASISKKKSFAVLSTDLTAGSLYQKYLIDTFASDCSVMSVPASPLVELLESNSSKTELLSYIHTVLPKSLLKRIDIIVLGCTHFPFITPLLTQYIGPDIAVLDSGDAVARQIERILMHNHQVSSSVHSEHVFITSGSAGRVSLTASHLCGEDIRYTHENI